MGLLRKNLFLICAIILIYGIYFATHVPSKQNEVHVEGAATGLTLFEQPNDGRGPLLDAIDNATFQIDIEVYLFSDKEIISHLINARNRGVNVNVMLEEHPFGGGNTNQKTQKLLQDSGINVEWTNPAFSLTHEKSIVIDKSQAFILNQNLTASSFSKNREFNIITQNSQDVLEVENIFNADWNRQSYTTKSTDLVVSPTNSRSILLGLLNGSSNLVEIEMEVIDDQQIIQALENKAKTETIEIIIPAVSQVPANKNVAEMLKKNGIAIKTESSPYIHAKLIIEDNATAYIGSENFTTQSLDSNRELGIITNQTDIIQTLNQDFTSDWEKATEFSN